jgi:succinate dehydrogenase / fumarate reductase iron-sulfur subunit
MKTTVFRIWRGDASGGEFRDYSAEVAEGMVVLDAVMQIQATQARDLAFDGIVKQESAGRARRK